MKVLCVDNKPRPCSVYPDILNKISEGESYEVYDEGLGKGADGTIEVVYFLVWINARPHGLAASRFVPLSDIDETELVNTKEEVYV